ncbi:Paternally-expressed gene 3 protein [Frankliniella fusca]|uniref:Paternally-expressed gene 3 protein n=1 Tax=Frankliniella fusca TaxID=407009 RepID=A0AAE1HTJ1_9NEOP|nr:Paternally-expressed gene 3 protein [Frankliniella fusca]
MRRAKLAAGSLPAGALPTTTYAIPRCFVCDEPIKSHRLSTSLLAGRTQYTHSPLPTKIGGYIGDEFIVVVTPQDALCKHCMALINTMDRLELELRQHRYTLTQHLKIKYKLDGQTAKQSKQIEIIEDDLDEPEIIEVSDEEWTPHKKPRTESVKHHKCRLCNASYTNLSLFMAHLSRHKQVDKVKSCAPLASSGKPSVNNNNKNFEQMKFKCGCCSEYFPTKESLALHMPLHTGPQPKPKVNCVLPLSMNNHVEERTSSSQLPKLESTIETSSLFEDIEQLSHQDIPVAEGVCLEEQKGRVCLLALLNNGVCSDLSHRAPAEINPQSMAKPPSVSCASKLSNQSNEQTISITVSIPSEINGGQMTEQHISFTSVSDSNVRNVSYPITLSNTSTVPSLATKPSSESSIQSKKPQFSGLKVEPGNANTCQGSAQPNNFDLPDLLDTSVDDSKVSTQTDRHPTQRSDVSPNKIACTWTKENSYSSETTTNGPLVSANGETQSLDMPSLLDELLESSDSRNEEIFGRVNDTCDLNPNTANNASAQHVDSSEFNIDSNLSKGSNTTETDKSSSESLASSDKNITDTVKNIAVVNVTGISVNRDSFDSENDWFYSSSDKDISTILNVKKLNEIDPPVPSSWFHDSDLTLAGKKLLNENCDASLFPVASDSRVNEQNTSSEESKSADKKELKKNSSLPSLV